MAAHFVCDPCVELGGVPERYQIVGMIEAEHGHAAVIKFEQRETDALAAFAVYGRSYVLAILDQAK